MFGKTWGEYVAFVKGGLFAIGVVWALRLGMSLGGIPDSIGKFASVTWVLVLALLYYTWAVHSRGFGSFRQIYPLALVLAVFTQTLIVLAIALAIFTGRDNIYTVPEFYPPAAGGTPLPVDGKNWVHAAAHLVGGGIVFPLVGTLVGSLVLVVARKVSPRT